MAAGAVLVWCALAPNVERVLQTPLHAATTGLPLIDAVKAGDRAGVRVLLKQQPSALMRAEADGTTALHWAVRADDVEMVRLLLTAGADAAAATREGITPLALAAINGSAVVTETLLKAGANPNVALPEGETILMTAARTGRPDVLKLLLEAGADLDARENWFGETALMWAAAENHADAVRVLVAAGADVNARSRLLDVPRRRNGQSILPLGSWTPLMYAARQGAHEALGALIDARADLNLIDPDGATALVIAIINANYDEAALLVESGADPNIGDKEAKMAALYAAVDMHRLAIGHGRPNTRPSGRLDAVDLIEMLLAHGADPNARLAAPLMQRHHTAGDRALGEGSTPFMRAAKSGDVAVMRLLLAAGADPLLKQSNQATALMLAAGLGWRDGSPAAPSYDQGSEQDAIEAIKLCMQVGIDINAATSTGETALHAAISGRGAESIVRFLVESGADLAAKNKQGRTPLDVAVASRRELGGIVGFLKQKMNPLSPPASAAKP
jgi:ankyrin repeat protein